MNTTINREQALALLLKYNKDSFHLEHALTVEGVMGWYARELGYGDEEAFWRLAGLLHDIDYEQYPDEHCQKAPALLAEINAGEDLTHAVCSHGYGLVSDVEPTASSASLRTSTSPPAAPAMSSARAQKTSAGS